MKWKGAPLVCYTLGESTRKSLSPEEERKIHNVLVE